MRSAVQEIFGTTDINQLDHIKGMCDLISAKYEELSQDKGLAYVDAKIIEQVDAKIIEQADAKIIE